MARRGSGGLLPFYRYDRKSRYVGHHASTQHITHVEKVPMFIQLHSNQISSGAITTKPAISKEYQNCYMTTRSTYSAIKLLSFTVLCLRVCNYRSSLSEVAVVDNTCKQKQHSLNQNIYILA